MAYKWAEHWYGGDDKPTEAVQGGFAKPHAPLPVEVPFPLSLHPPTIPEEAEESPTSPSPVPCVEDLSMESTPSLPVPSSDYLHSRTPELSSAHGMHSTQSTLESSVMGATHDTSLMGATHDASLMGVTHNTTMMNGTDTEEGQSRGAASADLMHLNHISLLGVDLPLCTGRYRQDFKVSVCNDPHA